MGVIKDGKVSGFIPNSESFAVHYPGYPSSISRAIQTLGGTEAIIKARSSDSNKLELYFRPEDPYSHPVSGQIRPCNGLLLKIAKKKSSSSSGATALNEAETKVETEISADIVAQIPEAYHFEGMADYQHVVAVHADVARKKKRNWTEMGESHFGNSGLVDLDVDDQMILLPPLFANKDMPENLVLRVPANSKKKEEEAVEHHFEMHIEPALAIDFNVKGYLSMMSLQFTSRVANMLLNWSLSVYRCIPKEINWRKYILKGSKLWQWQTALSELFEERPIWQKESLTECLLDKGLKFNRHIYTRLLLTVAYYFSSGPFLRFWIRKGYDPRKDPDSRIYQRIDFRVPPPLRSYCDAKAANNLKHRWEDLCKFQIFPFKCQTSLQLYELDDDYIQQEIRKPSKQTKCTYAAGWFLPRVLDSLRLRVAVRFLSIYPEPGAEKFLKTASEDFEKSKKAYAFKDVLKHDQAKHQQIDREVIGGEATENQNEVDDGQADEIEADESEEEMDGCEALDLDGEDGEISLQQSYMEKDSNSRNYLQELFDSFPAMDTNGDIQDADNSDAEYEIYEQDDDEYPDEDDN